MPMLISCFDSISDNRVTGRTTYDIKHALLFIVLALLSNAKSYRGIAVFIEERRKLLCKVFGGKWGKSPAHNTIRDILHSVTAAELENSFRSHATRLEAAMKQVKKGKQFKQISFDGKALCGSIDPSIDKRFIQLLSGFSVEGKIILCHYEIDEKSNEIPALQKLIEELGLKGVLITADAMHCQKKLLK
ncbi:MAG: ISAs1 family transposase [Patescibacteria group bacterium]